MNKLFLLVAGMAMALTSAREAAARTLEIYTLDAPPLVIEKGDNHGIHGDVLLEAVKRAGFDAQLVFLPWRRGQITVANGVDLLIIPFARTPEREPNYTWIANIYTVERTFATLDAPIDSIEQAKSRNTLIMVGQGATQGDFLRNNGISNLQSQPVGVSEIEMLTKGRVTSWFNSTPETLWKWKQSGHKEKLFIGKPITSDEVWVACSKKCSSDITGPIAEAIDAMRQDGSLKKIIDKYLSGE
jgi:polar amino acid transport system substrate-binding protein